jgi:hypothetical protein
MVALLRRAWFPLLLVLVALGFAVERLIVTDEEALVAWAEAMSEAASTGDRDRARTLISEEFVYGTLDRDKALDLAWRARRNAAVGDLTLSLVQIQIKGDEAHAEGIISAASMARRAELTTRMRFQRSDGGWLLVQAEPVSWGR